MSTTPPRQRRTVEDRKEQLVELGLALFAERSYDELSIDEIAQAAGISKGLLYHYFPSKRAFYVATIEKASEQLLLATELPRSEPDAPPTLDALRASLDSFLRYVEERAVSYVFLLRSGVGADPSVRDVVERTRRVFADRAAALIPATPTMRVAVYGWVGFVEAATVEWIETPDVSRAQLVQLIVDALAGVAGAAPLQLASR